MDVIGAQADDEEQDFIRNVCEKEVLSVENLLGMFAPLIKDICSSPMRFPDPKVQHLKNYVSLIIIVYHRNFFNGSISFATEKLIFPPNMMNIL